MIDYSPQAKKDVRKILNEIYDVSKSEETARNYVREMIAKAEAKEKYPKSGSPVYVGSRFSGYYFVIYKAYLAFYYPVEDGIRVDRFLPMKSNYGKWLKKAIK